MYLIICKNSTKQTNVDYVLIVVANTKEYLIKSAQGVVNKSSCCNTILKTITQTNKTPSHSHLSE